MLRKQKQMKAEQNKIKKKVIKRGIIVRSGR